MYPVMRSSAAQAGVITRATTDRSPTHRTALFIRDSSSQAAFRSALFDAADEHSANRQRPEPTRAGRSVPDRRNARRSGLRSVGGSIRGERSPDMIFGCEL